MKKTTGYLTIPKSYQPILDIRETEIAIKQIKDHFEQELAKVLKLTRVSAPLFVYSESGLNDNLSGVEHPVSFTAKDIGNSVEIVHSLAKWKRLALHRYGFNIGEGLYTDMDAIRKDEDLDNLHSIYVDQWDWEKVISKQQRNKETLKHTVKKIYDVFKSTENLVYKLYPQIGKALPADIFFITSQQLEERFPNLSPKEREHEIAKLKGAVFISEIGDKLKSGKKHDNRSPDYDDWNLNGDILLWYPLLNKPLELSSMGIRVDENSLEIQLEKANQEDLKQLHFHSMLLNKELPYTIGGGLGQSRICMYFLKKAHIGEVQATIWPQSIVNKCRQSNIFLL
ncbi:aspartate--ammonia ligase [Proteinivorax tanatarense]|uniref:Aspartate--ammonia ligase n=1 Tax=Proteinivorax tanatarense TaxID=1260629 RepID=A0AAU7VKR8_9FIRM